MQRTKTISYDNRTRFFWLLASVSILSLFVYIYAINATARNVADRQSLERQVAKSSTDLSALEFAFIEIKNDVTLELAYSHGFQEARNPLYVSRPDKTLTLNTLDR